MPSTRVSESASETTPEARPPGTRLANPRAAGWVPLAAVLLVGLFGLLLASFPARNLDLWKHLAAGRDLVRGAAGPGPTWLYDLATYAIYTVAGGAGLVGAKALACALTALLVFRLCRAQGGWRLPLAAAGLAVLAMGNRLLLQPATFSVLLQAIAVWLALRERARPAAERGPWPGWRLVLLFVVWANAGPWVVLGLGAVALVWLGDLLDGRLSGGPRALGRWAGAVLVLVVASCLSPAHLNGFRVPHELVLPGRAGEGLDSAFDRSYFRAFRDSPTALAYYPLLGFGLLSFLVNRSGWRWAWFLPWLGLAVVSVLQIRMVPFFAVVAGPVLAWNLQEAFARRGQLRGVRWPVRYAAFGLAALLGVGLLASAWAGWLQGPPYGVRQWAVETPVGIERGAEFVRRTHAGGLWNPDTRTLHVSPDTASGFAWFCPEDRGVRDDAAVLGLLGPAAAGDPTRARLRELGTNRIVVLAGDPGARPVLDRLMATPDEWPVLHVTGGLVVFGWRDPDRADAGDAYRGWEVDFDRLAFRPTESEVAPPAGPAGKRRWWEAFWKPPLPPRPPARDEAVALLARAEALPRSAPFRHLIAWEASQAGGLAAAAAGWVAPGGAADAALRLAFYQPPLPPDGPVPAVTQLVLAYQQAFAAERGDAPVGILYAAVRAARRAVAENPADAVAHLVLGKAYIRLLVLSPERRWADRMPQLRRVRLIQAVAALNRAAALNPRLAEAHLELGQLYQAPGIGCLDLAAEHLREYLELTPPRPGREDDHRAAVAAGLERLAAEVDRQAREFAREAERTSVGDRAAAANRRGLGGRARDLLVASDVSAFGVPGTELELDLLLRTGRPADVLEWLTDEVRGSVGDFSYHLLRAQAFAALGDYAAADAELAEVAAPGGVTPDPARVGGGVARLIGKVLLDERPGQSDLSAAVWRVLSRSDYQNQMGELARLLSRQAEATVVRGVVALEAGNVDAARAAFRTALTFAPPRLGGEGLEFGGRWIAWDCLGMIDRGGS